MARTYPPCAEVLREVGSTPDHAAAAKRLRARVELWRRQRLWSINLAPELVLHDDRHVSSVDRLASGLIEPLVRSAALDPFDVEALSCAAWLHDWGHVGGPVGFGSDAMIIAATDPRDVRRFHGLISQQLLQPQWAGMHGIEDQSTCQAAGVLCAHHTGKSSFGSDPGEAATALVGLVDEVPIVPKSLAAEVAQLTEAGGRWDLAKAQLLVALLRVSDGADIGVHRVPDAGPAKGAFLARCILMQAWRTIDQVYAEGHKDAQRGVLLTALAITMERASTLASLRRDTADANGTVKDLLDLLLPHAAVSPAIDRLVDYIKFTVVQGPYYEAHLTTKRVSFAVEHGASGRQPVHRVVVRVQAADDAVGAAAVRVVHTDIWRELDRGAQDLTVKEALKRHGIVFSRVELEDSSLRPLEFKS